MTWALVGAVALLVLAAAFRRSIEARRERAQKKWDDQVRAHARALLALHGPEAERVAASHMMHERFDGYLFRKWKGTLDALPLVRLEQELSE